MYCEKSKRAETSVYVQRPYRQGKVMYCEKSKRAETSVYVPLRYTKHSQKLIPTTAQQQKTILINI
jgi:hypothetical protein